MGKAVGATKVRNEQRVLALLADGAWHSMDEIEVGSGLAEAWDRCCRARLLEFDDIGVGHVRLSGAGQARLTA